jgi:3-mercaptopyruvate sulfurtransferase SseA
MATLAIRALALLLLGAVLGIAANAVRPDGIALRGFSPTVTCSASAAGHGAAVEVLPPSRAAGLCGESRALIADARPPDRFAAGHVAEAVHLPCAASGAQASSVMGRLAGVSTVIVYGDSTEEARPVAEDLRRRAGRPDLRVVVLEGGFPAWSRAGLACASGPCRTCTEEGSGR